MSINDTSRDKSAQQQHDRSLRLKKQADRIRVLRQAAVDSSEDSDSSTTREDRL